MRRMIPQKDIEKLDSITLTNNDKNTIISNERVEVHSPTGSLSVGPEGNTYVYGDVSIAIGGDYSPAVGDYNYVLDIGANGYQFQHLNEDSEELETFVTFGKDISSISGAQEARLISGVAVVNAGTSNQKPYATMGFFDEEASDTGAEIRVDNEGIKIDPDFAAVGTRYLILSDIPTADPHVAGAVWNDSGVLKISSGN